MNLFFDWEHSSLADKNRITYELKNGFSVEQFDLVGDISIGDWQVNVTNLNTKVNSEPFLLKCSVQYNFGKPNQSEEEHLIRLDKSDTKEQFFYKFKVEQFYTCKTPILKGFSIGAWFAAPMPIEIQVRVSSGSITASVQIRAAA